MILMVIIIKHLITETASRATSSPSRWGRRSGCRGAHTRSPRHHPFHYSEKCPWLCRRGRHQ